MKQIFATAVELAYLTLQFPNELSVYLDKIPYMKTIERIMLVLVSLSIASGLYSMRDYYSPAWAMQLILIAASVFLFLTVWVFLFSGSLDAAVQQSRRGAEQIHQAAHTRSLIHLSLIPFLFFQPASQVSGLFSRPSYAMLPFFLLISVWCIFIQLKGLQYLYELSMAATVKAYIKSLLYVSALPFLIFFVLFSMGAGL